MGRDFPHPSRLSLGTRQPPVTRVPFLFLVVKSAGALRCSSTHLTPRIKKENSYICTFLSALSQRFLGWKLLYFYGEVNENCTVHWATHSFHHMPSLFAEPILPSTSGVPRGFRGSSPSPEIRKVLLNRAKLNPSGKTVKNCWI